MTDDSKCQFHYTWKQPALHLLWSLIKDWWPPTRTMSFQKSIVKSLICDVTESLTILLGVLQNSVHVGDRITDLRTFTTLFRPRRVAGETSGSSRPSSTCAWQAGLRDFLGSKDLLVLRPLRHEPTAQYYLPRDSSQRLPSVRETETGFRIRPEALDWPSPRWARG